MNNGEIPLSLQWREDDSSFADTIAWSEELLQLRFSDSDDVDHMVSRALDFSAYLDRYVVLFERLSLAQHRHTLNEFIQSYFAIVELRREFRERRDALLAQLEEMEIRFLLMTTSFQQLRAAVGAFAECPLEVTESAAGELLQLTRMFAGACESSHAVAEAADLAVSLHGKIAELTSEMLRSYARLVTSLQQEWNQIRQAAEAHAVSIRSNKRTAVSKALEKLIEAERTGYRKLKRSSYWAIQRQDEIEAYASLADASGVLSYGALISLKDDLFLEPLVGPEGFLSIRERLNSLSLARVFKRNTLAAGFTFPSVAAAGYVGSRNVEWIELGKTTCHLGDGSHFNLLKSVHFAQLLHKIRHDAGVKVLAVIESTVESNVSEGLRALDGRKLHWLKESTRLLTVDCHGLLLDSTGKRDLRCEASLALVLSAEVSNSELDRDRLTGIFGQAVDELQGRNEPWCLQTLLGRGWQVCDSMADGWSLKVALQRCFGGVFDLQAASAKPAACWSLVDPAGEVPSVVMSDAAQCDSLVTVLVTLVSGFWSSRVEDRPLACEVSQRTLCDVVEGGGALPSGVTKAQQAGSLIWRHHWLFVSDLSVLAEAVPYLETCFSDADSWTVVYGLGNVAKIDRLLEGRLAEIVSQTTLWNLGHCEGESAALASKVAGNHWLNEQFSMKNRTTPKVTWNGSRRVFRVKYAPDYFSTLSRDSSQVINGVSVLPYPLSNNRYSASYSVAQADLLKFLKDCIAACG